MDEPKTNELDNLALNIELTLVSIIQGVALYFLVEYSRDVLIGLRFFYWPYVAAGLTFLFLVWSRIILHALTIIRWPLDFVHNFLYITVTLLECLAFTQVNDPLAWFTCCAAFSVVMWILFIWDMRLIPATQQCTPKQKGLCNLIREEQVQSIRLWMPLTFLFNAGAAWAIYRWPHFFIEKQGHIYLIGAQCAAAVYFVVYSIRIYQKIMPVLTRVRTEESDILTPDFGPDMPTPNHGQNPPKP